MAFLPVLKNTLLAFFRSAPSAPPYYSHPEFATRAGRGTPIRWDSRIMADWPAACAVWASHAEMKDGQSNWRAITLALCIGLFLIWILTLSSYDTKRHNGLTFGTVKGLYLRN